MLKQKLSYPLKSKNERQFIYLRLRLFDQLYCLEIDLELQQSYLEAGLHEHRWPDQLYAVAQTMDFDFCQQYIDGYIENLKKQLNECQLELMKQSESCPITHVTLDQIDRGLKEFVDTQPKYLCTRNDGKLAKLKCSHHCEKLYKALSQHGLTQEQ
ncbi:unnamed protein product, partial [Didymodactylos carnosus]